MFLGQLTVQGPGETRLPVGVYSGLTVCAVLQTGRVWLGKDRGMKTERTPFLAMGAVMFLISFGVAVMANTGPSVLLTWLTFAFLGLGTALVSAGLVRAVLNERSSDVP